MYVHEARPRIRHTAADPIVPGQQPNRQDDRLTSQPVAFYAKAPRLAERLRNYLDGDVLCFGPERLEGRERNEETSVSATAG